MTAFEAGFYPGVDEQDYHSGAFGPSEGSLSVSGAKTLLKAPALFRWQQEHPVHKAVFDFGTAAHKMVLGVGADLVVHEYDAEKVKSPKATNAWKTQQAEVRAAGGVLLLPDEFAAVSDMADALSTNTLAMELLSRGKPEVSAYAVDEPTGVWRRARFDWLADDILSDYKSSVTAHPDALDRVVHSWRYFQQAPWYLDLARDLGHLAKAFAFIFQEKEPPYLVSVVDLDADALRLGREKNREALERFRDCRDSGIWPGYQADGCFTTISLPRYAFYDRAAS